ncbi:MAG TPA: TAXI family TRAP transporter solute-binding subunit [Pseudomonadota bacterium]|nr:TAXI family TRAP transporter solute-binding subunit [Pseudomonadota bacterium]
MAELPIRKTWTILLIAAALAAAGSMWFFFLRATVVTIAVAPPDGDEAKLLAAYAEALRQQRLDLQVRLLRVDTLQKSAEALQNKQAELAVVRPDVLLPVDGLTVTVLHEDAALFIAPSGASLTDVGDLAQRKLGVIVQHEADAAAITAILAYYDLAPPRVTLVPLTLTEASAALAAQRVEAVALVATPGSAVVSALVKSLNKVAESKMKVLTVNEAAAIAEELPRFSEVEIPAGGLGGARKQPPEEVKTVGVSYRLMARSELDRVTVARLTQALFQLRSRLARATPLANRMQAIDPDSAVGAALPNHPGAIDYFAREQKTFLERYADYIYIILFSGGGVVSGLAWLRQRVMKRRRELVDKLLDRLLVLLAGSRAATSNRQLDQIAAEVDSLVVTAVRQARKRASGTRTMGALILAIDSTRAAIMDRRIAVNGGPAAPSHG